jgi:DNA (cytosine-5)-methyltransferase 1
VNSNRIPLLSFFVGGGFLDMGFEEADFDIIWTNECEPAFIKGYEAGITAWRKSKGREEPAQILCAQRIERVSTLKIISQAFPTDRPPVFGIIGGPPCPDFSMAGKNQGHTGENGKLSRIFVNRICELSPDFFVFENVPGLTIRHKKFFDSLVLKLRNSPAQYVCDYKILNALDYGVPQDRNRIFLIGVKPYLFERYFDRQSKSGEEGWFTWPSPKYPNARENYQWPEAVRKLKEEPAKPYGIPEELMAGVYLNGSNPPQSHPNGSDEFRPHSRRFKTTKEGDISHKSFKRLHRWRYSPTAAYGNNEVHLHPWENRRLSVREVLRIQSAPDAYILPADMTLTAKFKMIANGVPVKLAQAIAISLSEFLKTAWK